MPDASCPAANLVFMSCKSEDYQYAWEIYRFFEPQKVPDNRRRRAARS